MQGTYLAKNFFWHSHPSTSSPQCLIYNNTIDLINMGLCMRRLFVYIGIKYWFVALLFNNIMIHHNELITGFKLDQGGVLLLASYCINYLWDKRQDWLKTFFFSFINTMSMKSKERRGHKGLCEGKENIKQGQDEIRDSSNLKWPQIAAAAYNKRNHKISLNSK